MKITRNELLPILVFTTSFIVIVLPLTLSILGSNIIIEGWGIISMIIISVAIVAIIFDFKNQLSSKKIALIATLGTLIAVLRIPFTFLPSIQPCTFLIICTGITFGSSIGFLVGIMTPLISNLFLGHGPWTPLQMYAWGAIGVLAGLLKFNPKIRIWKLGVFGIASSYFFGFLMNIWFWYSFLYPLTLSTFIIAEAQGIYFDTLHAIGTFVFLTIIGNKTLRILDTFKKSLV